MQTEKRKWGGGERGGSDNTTNVYVGNEFFDKSKRCAFTTKSSFIEALGG